MSTTTPTSKIEYLRDLDDEDFREVVDRDLRRESDDAEASALRSPALVDRWFMVLVAMGKSVEAQLAARKEDFEGQKVNLRQQREVVERRMLVAIEEGDQPRRDEAREELVRLNNEWAEVQQRYRRTRAGTLRFKGGLEEWIVEARELRNSIRDRLYDTVVVEERNRLAERVRSLEMGIAAHRSGLQHDPTATDLALWALVPEEGLTT